MQGARRTASYLEAGLNNLDPTQAEGFKPMDALPVLLICAPGHISLKADNRAVIDQPASSASRLART